MTKEIKDDAVGVAILDHETGAYHMAVDPRETREDMYGWDHCDHSKGIGKIGCVTCDPIDKHVRNRLRWLEDHGRVVRMVASPVEPPLVLRPRANGVDRSAAPPGFGCMFHGERGEPCPCFGPDGPRLQAEAVARHNAEQAKPKPTDDWCQSCGEQAADLRDGKCVGCQPTIPRTVRVLASDIAAMERDLEHARRQVTELQARCTALVEERRAVDWVAQLQHMFRIFEQEQPERPGWPAAATVSLRKRLIREEFQETIDALNDGDLVEFADGCVDLAVVALGGLLACGIDPRPIWRAVYETNVAKCVDGKLVRSAEGKVQKPVGWSPPDVAGLLAAQGWKNPSGDRPRDQIADLADGRQDGIGGTR